MAGDLTTTDAATVVVHAVVDRTGRLDVLVNNAGIARDRYITKLTDDDWEACLGVNATAPFRLLRAAVPVMKDGGGGAVPRSGGFRWTFWTALGVPQPILRNTRPGVQILLPAVLYPLAFCGITHGTSFAAIDLLSPASGHRASLTCWLWRPVRPTVGDVEAPLSHAP